MQMAWVALCMDWNRVVPSTMTMTESATVYGVFPPTSLAIIRHSIALCVRGDEKSSNSSHVPVACKQLAQVPPVDMRGSQQTRDAIKSLWRQNDVTMSFSHHNDIIIASCARWDAILFLLSHYMSVTMLRSKCPMRSIFSVRRHSPDIPFFLLPTRILCLYDIKLVMARQIHRVKPIIEVQLPVVPNRKWYW